MPFLLATGAVFLGVLVAAIIFINKANGPAPTPSPTPSAASCATASFGAPLQPVGEPANAHVYSAAPAMQIDVTIEDPKAYTQPFTVRVNGTVNSQVICVFHAPFTGFTVHSNGRPVGFHQIGIEEHRSIGGQLSKFAPQIRLL